MQFIEEIGEDRPGPNVYEEEVGILAAPVRLSDRSGNYPGAYTGPGPLPISGRTSIAALVPTRFVTTLRTEQDLFSHLDLNADCIALKGLRIDFNSEPG